MGIPTEYFGPMARKTVYESQAEDTSVQQFINPSDTDLEQKDLWCQSKLLPNFSLFADYVLVFQKVSKEFFL